MLFAGRFVEPSLSCRVTFSVNEKKRNANFFVLFLFNHYHHKALKLFVSRAHGLGRKEGRKKGKKGKKIGKPELCESCKKEKD